MILVTGANGFIGSKLVNFFCESNRPVRSLSRNEVDLSGNFDNLNTSVLTDIFKDIDTVIHAAAKVHSMKKTELDAIEAYRSVNVNGTCLLAEKAAAAGVRRFIFLSSLKVNAETSDDKLLFSPDLNENRSDLFNKRLDSLDSYVISKYEAEKKLLKISARTGLEVVILRLPLVYGPGAKGNLARLIKLLELNLPIPLASVKNRRSFIGIDNLINIIDCCIDHADAPGKIFLVSDGKDLSTPDLLRLIASSMGRSALLFPFPILLLKLFSFFIGKSREMNRLSESLQADINYTMKTLNWLPPVSVEDGLRRMVKDK